MRRRRRTLDEPIVDLAPPEPTSEFVRVVPARPAEGEPEPSEPPPPAPPVGQSAEPSTLDEFALDEFTLDDLASDELVEFDDAGDGDETGGLLGIDDLATRDMVRFLGPDGAPLEPVSGGGDDPFADPFALDAELPAGLGISPPDPLLAAPPATPDPTAPLRFRRRAVTPDVSAGDTAEPAPASVAPSSGPAPRTPPPPVVIVDDDVARVPSPAAPRRKLVIGDDLDDAPLASSGPAPSPTRSADRTGTAALPIDPRLRRRRIDVRRAAGRRRLLLVIVGLVVAAALIGAAVLLASPVFSVDQVDVQGAVYTTQAEIDAIVASVEGDPILTLDTDALERKLVTLPWVRSARVQADFPSTLRIELAERVPVASYQGADAQWRVIDREGRVIAVIADGAEPTDFLQIAGAGPDVAAGVEAGDLYRVAGELALALPAELRVVTKTITLADSGEIGLVLTSGTVVGFGQPNDLRAKLARLITLLRENPPAELSEVNLSDPGNPGFTKVP